MNYFKNCTTIDQLKNKFRELCKKLHPDHKGNQQEFIQMYNEFKRLSKKAEFYSGKQYNNVDADKFYNLIKMFDHLPENVYISFVGTFIWIEGATYECKEEIKSISLDGYNKPRFARRKKAWYFSPLDYKKKSGKRFELNQIKSKYGCETFKGKRKLLK